MLLVSKLQNWHRKACHAGGREFESRPVRHFDTKPGTAGKAASGTQFESKLTSAPFPRTLQYFCLITFPSLVEKIQHMQ